jgi:hypothetical protein
MKHVIINGRVIRVIELAEETIISSLNKDSEKFFQIKYPLQISYVNAL